MKTPLVLYLLAVPFSSLNAAEKYSVSLYIHFGQFVALRTPHTGATRLPDRYKYRAKK